MGLAFLRSTATPALAFVLGAASPALSSARTINIGYQKYGTLVLEKTRGTLEKHLVPVGVAVHLTEFLGRPALLEAMDAGSIDFGISGDAPPIFAQAAGVDLAYVGVEPASPHGGAIIALQSSSIQIVADLRGKRIALNKGGNVRAG